MAQRQRCRVPTPAEWKEPQEKERRSALTNLRMVRALDSQRRGILRRGEANGGGAAWRAAPSGQWTFTATGESRQGGMPPSGTWWKRR